MFLFKIFMGDNMFVKIEKNSDKIKNYEILLENLQYYLVESDSLITNFSNLSAYLNYFLDDINWVGFYLFDGEKLYLGPFQGLPACTEIKVGVGVCGKCALDLKTVVVEDVDAFPSHIACDSASKSEIVVPIIKNNILIGVLDIDSPSLRRFDLNDQFYLEKVIEKLVDIL
jgi:GAF domain-containing protein